MVREYETHPATTHHSFLPLPYLGVRPSWPQAGWKPALLEPHPAENQRNNRECPAEEGMEKDKKGGRG